MVSCQLQYRADPQRIDFSKVLDTGSAYHSDDSAIVISKPVTMSHQDGAGWFLEMKTSPVCLLIRRCVTWSNRTGKHPSVDPALRHPCHDVPAQYAAQESESGAAVAKLCRRTKRGELAVAACCTAAPEQPKRSRGSSASGTRHSASRLSGVHAQQHEQSDRRRQAHASLTVEQRQPQSASTRFACCCCLRFQAGSASGQSAS